METEAKTLIVDLVTPERLLFSETAHLATLPGEEGEFGVLAGHAPFVSLLKPGIVNIQESEGAAPRKIFVSGGFAEVSPESCTVLAEEAFALSDLKVEDIEKRLKTAQSALAEAQTEPEQRRAEKQVAVAEAMLAALAA